MSTFSPGGWCGRDGAVVTIGAYVAGGRGPVMGEAHGCLAVEIDVDVERGWW